MTGGLMQLVAYGAQDIYLTGNPMITYFKVVYRRHTNFAMESIEQTFSGSVAFGQKVSCLISRNGDLVSGVTLEAVLPTATGSITATTVKGLSPGVGFRWIDDVGHYLIEEVTVEIGGQLIDRHWSDWLEIWAQLTVPAGQKVGYRQMIGQDPVDHLGRPTGLQKDLEESVTTVVTARVGAPTVVQPTIAGRKIFVPLQFWFCRNIGLALPLIALQYHEVKINVSFRSLSQLLSSSNNVVDGANFITAFDENNGSASSPGLSASLWVDYIYLDTDERRRFAQVSHEYLIEQLQRSSGNAVEANAAVSSTSVRLDFNHPVKELVWFYRADTNVNVKYNQWSNYTNDFMGVVAQGAHMLPNVAAGETEATSITTFAVTASTDAARTAGTYLVRATDGTLVNTPGRAAVFKVVVAAGGVLESVTLVDPGTGYAAGPGTLTLALTPGADVDLTAVTVGGATNVAFAHATEFTDPFTQYSIAAAQGTNVLIDAARAGLSAITSEILFQQIATSFKRPVDEATGSLIPSPISGAKLVLNGHDRFAERPGSYFNWVQCQKHHTNIPESQGIHVYSFALKPEEHQPSGTCNFSRIDNAKLQLSFIAGILVGKVCVYATNYNVLRIMSGMGGLAYSN